MSDKLKYQDLLYFGYEYDKGSKETEIDFIKEIKEQFPNVKLIDCFDGIKGYRQEVYLEEENNDNYYSWLIAKQWFDCSLSFQLMAMSGEESHKSQIEKYISLAKQQYPEEFKQVSNEDR